MILIDPRAGSGPRTVKRIIAGRERVKEYKGLIEYPPLNTCVDCGEPFAYRQVKGQSERAWQCASSNAQHNSLGCHHELGAGDVCFSGQGPGGPILIGVEVKHITDLVSSLDAGRLQGKQIPDMVRDYDVRWLLYYGSYRQSAKDGSLQVKKIGKGEVRWESVKLGNRIAPYGYHGAFLVSPSFTEIPEFRSERVYDMAEAAAWIGVLYRTWQKPYDKHKSMRTFDRSRELTQAAFQRIALGQAADSRVTPLPGVGLDEREFQCATTANTFPAVGFERAVAVGKHFKSVRAMVNAGPEEWAKVDGIGPVIARKVEEAIK